VGGGGGADDEKRLIKRLPGSEGTLSIGYAFVSNSGI